MELLIYSDWVGPRLRYVADVLFGRLLPCSYRLSADPEDFLQHSGPRLQYGGRRLSPTAVYLPAGALLREEGIRPLSPDVFFWEGLPAFFREDAAPADLPFDLPALLFYLLSRYEEYLPYPADRHGRFPATASLAFRAGFLQRPLVNQWSLRLTGLLNDRFPGWQPLPTTYSFQPTYDVDLAWAFLHRGTIRQVGGALRDLWSGRARQLLLRAQVLAGRQADPFFTFDALDRLHERYDLRPRYFFLLADPGPYDRNIAADHPALRRLIRRLHQRYDLGIHPSYRSHEDPGALEQEISRLQTIIDAPVTACRQHFLRLRLPTTYRRLLSAGLQADYSMGYADHPGFRASMAVTYPWYDLERDLPTNLMIHPFQVMDVTLRDYLGLLPEQAPDQASSLIDAVRQCQGTFCTLWHNSSLSARDGWEGWQRVYETIVGAAAGA